MNTRDLLEMFSRPDYRTNYTLAKATKACLRCGNPANAFRNFSAEFEYQISALCQICQDNLFRRKEE